MDLLSKAPACASPCVIKAFQAWNCSFSDVTNCICSNVQLQSQVSTCIQTSCRWEDQIKAVTLSNQLCQAYPKPSRSHEVKLTAIIGAAIVFPIIALRLFARIKTTRRLWMDDYMTIVATICLAGLTGIEIASAYMGFGLHYWNTSVENSMALLQMFYAVQMLYILIQVFAKAAILLLFARIFPARWFQITVKIFNIFLFGHGIIFLFLIIFQCVPVNSIWLREVTDRKCLDLSAIGYAGAGFSIAEDVAIFILPITEVIELQLNLRKRIGVLVLFGIGSFAVITSMVRLKYLVMFSNSYDTTWDNVDVVKWSMIEEYSAMLCGSLPTLRPLIQQWSPAIFGTTRRYKFSKEGNSQVSTSEIRNKNSKGSVAPLAGRNAQFGSLSKSDSTTLRPDSHDEETGLVGLNRSERQFPNTQHPPRTYNSAEKKAVPPNEMERRIYVTTKIHQLASKASDHSMNSSSPGQDAIELVESPTSPLHTYQHWK